MIMPAYAVSKLANVMFTQELARRCRQHDMPILAFAVHPGMVASGFATRNWLLSAVGSYLVTSEQAGAYTSEYCATSLDLEDGVLSGQYYDDCKLTAANPNITKDKNAELWRRSVEWCSIKDPLPPLVKNGGKIVASNKV